MRRLGLRYVSTDALTIRRQRKGDGYRFVSARGRTIRDEITRARLKRLAVPPAYEDVLYAADPRAHIQAIGRDAAGRLQYRYHAEWEKVREQRKAQPPAAAGRSAAAHPPRGEQASRRSPSRRANSRSRR